MLKVLQVSSDISTFAPGLSCEIRFMADAQAPKASDRPASEQSEDGKLRADDAATANRREALDKHADELLRSKRPIKKKPRQRRMCKFFSNGHCRYGKRCHFSHIGKRDLQAKYSQNQTNLIAAVTHGAVTAVLEHCKRSK